MPAPDPLRREKGRSAAHAPWWDSLVHERRCRLAVQQGVVGKGDKRFRSGLLQADVVFNLLQENFNGHLMLQRNRGRYTRLRRSGPGTAFTAEVRAALQVT